MHLFEQRKALRLALIGMNIMPWGTLALATITGAYLSNVNANELGKITSLVSFLVFPYLSIIGIGVLEEKKSLWSMIKAIFFGFVFSTMLFLSNKYLIVEIAGIFSGLMTTLIILTITKKANDNILDKSKLFFAFLPYILVLFIVFLFKTVNYLFPFNIEDQHASLLQNPGIILLLVAILLQLINKKFIPLFSSIKRSVKASTTIISFILLSELMTTSGMINNMVQFIMPAKDLYLTFISPLLGMLSGFVTGSNTAGNAMMMKVQQQLGIHSGNQLLFEAIQNSSAGHMVFSTLPIIMLVITIAKGNINSKHQMLED